MAAPSTASVRTADATEAPALAQLWTRSARAGFGPLLPDGFAWPAVDGTRIAEAIAGFETRVLVADVDDAIAGYATFGPARDDDLDGIGELRSLFLDPAHWGSEAAWLLVQDGCDWLAWAGYSKVVVWSFHANDRANAFYARQGFRLEGEERALAEFAGLVAWRLIRPLSASATRVTAASGWSTSASSRRRAT